MKTNSAATSQTLDKTEYTIPDAIIHRYTLSKRLIYAYFIQNHTVLGSLRSPRSLFFGPSLSHRSTPSLFSDVIYYYILSHLILLPIFFNYGKLINIRRYTQHTTNKIKRRRNARTAQRTLSLDAVDFICPCASRSLELIDLELLFFCTNSLSRYLVSRVYSYFIPEKPDRRFTPKM